MTVKIKLAHSDTIFNRVLMPKLVSRIKYRSIFNIFNFRTLFNDQKWIRKVFRIILDEISIDFSCLKMVYRLKIQSFSNVFDFRTLIYQGSRWSRMDTKSYVGSFLNNFQSISHAKMIYKMEIRSIFNVFKLRTRF